MFCRIQANEFLIGLLLGLFVFCSPITTKAQAGVDDLFEQARKQAFAGNRKEARDLCAVILEKSSAYHDARILLGRLYAWDGQYEQARQELKIVVESSPDYRDARDALIDVELWSGNPKDALRYCEKGLDRYPNNESFLYKKARALKALGEIKAATIAARRALGVNPGNRDTQSLLDALEDADRRYKLTLDYSYDAFDKAFEPWHQLSVSLSRRLAFGTTIGRVNYAHRFSQSAVQYEVDAYPRIRKGTYAYVNAGYSSSSIFPRYRLGGEVFQNLPKGFEASLGMRRLHFSSADVNIFTGSVGAYYGMYWFSFRPFITPSDVGVSRSASITIRRYFESTESYVTLILGAGSSPDQRYTTLDQYRLNSQNVSMDGRKRLGGGFVGSAYFGFANQEIGIGRGRRRYTLGTAIEKYF